MTTALRNLLDAPSGWERLDPLAKSVKAVVDRLLPHGRLSNLLHGREIGHPSHPPLAQAVLSGWTGAAVLAAAELARSERSRSKGESREPSWAEPRPMLGLLGLTTVAPAVAAGLADWSQLHEDQQRTGLVHASIMSAAAVASLSARVARRPRRSAGLDLAAGLIATLGSAFGGHLAYRWSAGPSHAEAFPHLAKEGWVRICPIDDVAEGQLHPGTVGDEPIVVGRVDGQLFAMADRCSHLAGPLAEGELRSINQQMCLVCPWHGSAFRIGDGEAMAGPAYAPQPVLEVRATYGWVDVRARQLPGVAGR